MSITYGKTPLCYPTQEFDTHIKKYMPLGDHMRVENSNTWSLDSRIPVENESWPPTDIDPNTLYWPQGASRWGFFFGIAGETHKDAILAEWREGTETSNVMTLNIKEGSAEINPVMHLLSPQPFSIRKNTYWLIPLVDKRYFFHQAAMPKDFTVATWTALYSALIQTALGYSAGNITYDSIDSDYDTDSGAPGLFTASEASANPAHLLDAAAHTIGQRAVFDTDGKSIWMMGWTNSIARVDENLDRNASKQYGQPMAGASYGTQITSAPRSVVVSFPQAIGHCLHPNKDRYTYENEPSDLGLADDFTEDTMSKGLSASKIVHCQTTADYTDEEDWSAAPDNDAELSDLASQISGDYYLSLYRRYNMLYHTVRDWQANGFDNVVTYSRGSTLGETMRCTTRVQSHADNHGPTFHINGGNAYPQLAPPPSYDLFPCDGTQTISAGSAAARVTIWTASSVLFGRRACGRAYLLDDGGADDGKFSLARGYYMVAWQMFMQSYGASPLPGGIITAATTAEPIVCTSAAHGLVSGDVIRVMNRTGTVTMPEAQGVWTVKYVTGASFSLDGSVGNSTYVADEAAFRFSPTTRVNPQMWMRRNDGAGTFNSIDPWGTRQNVIQGGLEDENDRFGAFKGGPYIIDNETLYTNGEYDFIVDTDSYPGLPAPILTIGDGGPDYEYEVGCYVWFQYLGSDPRFLP